MKKPIINIILFIVALYSSHQSVCIAQDTIKEKNLLINGYVKDMQMVMFQDIQKQWITANQIHNRLNFTWLISPSFTAKAGMRNRVLYGNILRNFPGYNETFEQDNGLVNLSVNLFDQEGLFLMNTSIDRFSFGYSTSAFQITLGRQRINWGQTFVWNPNDIFNSYDYFDFDYEEKPGSDALRLQYYINPTSVFEAAVKFNHDKKATAAALYRFNKWKYDFQCMGGLLDQADYVIGTGWSGQILKGGFRGEASYFHPVKKFTDTTGVFVASAGYDYTLKNSLFLQFEGLYNGSKDSLNSLGLGQLNNTALSAKNIFLSDFSFFLSAAYPFNPLINASLSGILNPKHRLYYIIPSVAFSLTDNLELSVLAQIFGNYGSRLPHQTTNLIFLRLKGSF